MINLLQIVKKQHRILKQIYGVGIKPKKVQAALLVLFLLILSIWN